MKQMSLIVVFLVGGCGRDPNPVPTDGPPSGDNGGDNAGDSGGCMPRIEVCGDRMDQNCDGRDQSCGDNDNDRFPAYGTQNTICAMVTDPARCDCDDSQAEVYPGHPELCDGFDNDCNGRVDEAGECCPDCAAYPTGAGDICTTDNLCDCRAVSGTGPCSGGQACCGTGCSNLVNDVDNCGFCGFTCSPRLGSDTCVAGHCQCGTMAVGCNKAQECINGVCT